jgi:hypothetical protein
LYEISVKTGVFYSVKRTLHVFFRCSREYQVKMGSPACNRCVIFTRQSLATLKEMAR